MESSALDTKYIPQTRPYSQNELQDMMNTLYNSLKLGNHKAFHAKCGHSYFVKKYGKKETEIKEQNTCGNCSVCWKIHNSDQKRRVKNMVNAFTESEKLSYLTYDNVDLKTVFYKWLYED